MMTPEELAEKILTQIRSKISELLPNQVFLFGYIAAMRLFPAYENFSQKNPDFGNAELGRNIALGIRALVLGQEAPEAMDDWVNLLDQKHIPDLDDFGTESLALEASLALLFLYKYSKSKDPENIFEIFRGIIECILMSDDASHVLENLESEQSLRQQQFDLISPSDVVDDTLMSRCLELQQNKNQQ